MSSSSPRRILVTGANAGLGKECARQLALRDDVVQVILACRNKEKAEAAQNELEEATNKKIFQVLVVDVSDLDSVRQAVDSIDKEQPVDGLVLNAGGAGGKDPTALTKDGVTYIVACNLLGHALMVDLLIQQKKLVSGASIVYSGSEAARGMLGAPQLKTNGSVEDFVSICNGSHCAKPTENLYGHVKMMAAFWMASMSRSVPGMRFVSMSPGASYGTSIMQDSGPFLRITTKLVISTMKLFHQAHDVETGAKRYVDALYDTDTYQTGVFYASERGATGPVCDQSRFIPYLNDESFQDNCNEAIHTFLK